MNLPYHIEIVEKALADRFRPQALEELILANLAQDDLPGLLLHPERHFDNDLIPQALAYIQKEHDQIVASAGAEDGGQSMRVAFGRLTHTAQDFYAHSNYVDLWLAHHGGLDVTAPDQIDGVDPTLLTSPALRTWHFYLWRDGVYYIPIIRELARRIYMAPNSHEANHLDDPSRGPKFAYAMQAAQDRTRQEYERAIAAIREAGGVEAVVRFHGS
ncbi:MAG: hypothetical protein KA003_16580 [Caldilineaceae bacterium]|nr:hypothetical protein [Caldilineaceae bacterium]